MDKCMKCGRELSADEIGLHKKLFNRAAKEFMCIRCCSQYLDVPEDILLKKIKEFKAMGCVLFRFLH